MCNMNALHYASSAELHQVKPEVRFVFARKGKELLNKARGTSVH